MSGAVIYNTKPPFKNNPHSSLLPHKRRGRSNKFVKNLQWRIGNNEKER